MRCPYCIRLGLVAMLFVTAPAMRAQTPVTGPVFNGSVAPSDSLIVAGESDHIYSGIQGPGIQGGSGSVEWIHSSGPQLVFVVGASSEVLGQSHWTLAEGDLVWIHSRWIVETTLRAGKGLTAGQGFGYNDYSGAVTYRLFAHLYPSFKEEYLSIGSSHGNLVRGGVCLCNLHRFSTTLHVADSASGNLATEYLSIREETVTRLVNPFIESSIGKILPILVNPALNIHSAASDTFGLSVGGRLFPTRRRSFTVAASYVRDGQIRTLSLGASMILKLRGD